MSSVNVAPIRVLVGPERKCFYIHASTLTASSEFFKSALKDEWRKNENDAIDLPDHSEECFYSYAQWLYSGSLVAPTGESDVDETTDPEYVPLGKLYALGEHLIDTTFKDCVINAFVAKSKAKDKDGRYWYPAGHVVNIIYENTSAGSPARRLVVDLHVRYGYEKWIQLTNEKLNYDFLMDLSLALIKERKLPEGSRMNYILAEGGDLCKYHNHAGDKPCQGKSK